MPILHSVKEFKRVYKKTNDVKNLSENKFTETTAAPLNEDSG